MARSRTPSGPHQKPPRGPRRTERGTRKADPRITRNKDSRPTSPGRPQPAPAEPPRRSPASGPAPKSPPPRLSGSDYWLFGRHAVLAALHNPARRLKRLLLAEPADPDLAPLVATLGMGPEVVGRTLLDELLPGQVHQGIALSVSPLPQIGLAGFVAELMDRPAVVVALDHVTDPHNVGAILRSAAAFGAAAVIATSDHAPPEGGLVAKAASGALEVVPYLTEINLARALDQMKAAGFWCFGLDETGTQLLQAKDAAPRTCLVLGAEGSGLRRLTRERCDLLVRLPTRPPIAALNVSNAAAVALYELLGGT